jgi:hypothetical protein
MSRFTPPVLDIYRGPRGFSSGITNPYRGADATLDRRGGAAQRRRNLEAYLDLVGSPHLVLLGEAIGYRGGRFSGIPFTSERQLVGSNTVRLPWAGDLFRATSRNEKLWLEPSGSIVWGALERHQGSPCGVLLWNTFPWHPYGARGPLSNRTPEPALVKANLHVLERLLTELPTAARIAAVGRIAETALVTLGVTAVRLRHPAHGGANQFRSQLAALLASPANLTVVGLR